MSLTDLLGGKLITGLLHISDVPGEIADAVIDDNENNDIAGLTMVYVNLVPPGDTKTELKEFQIIMAYLMDDLREYVFVANYSGVRNQEDHPIVLAVRGIFTVREVPRDKLRELYPDSYYLVYSLTRTVSSTGESQFKSLDRYPTYKELAMEGYLTSFESSGMREYKSVMKKLGRYYLVSMHSELAGDPSPVELTNTLLTAAERVFSPKGGAYGHHATGNDAFQRCSTCVFARGGACIGHLLHTDIGEPLRAATAQYNVRRPANRSSESKEYYGIRGYVYAPIIFTSYLGPSRTVAERQASKSYSHVIIRMFCWTAWAEDLMKAQADNSPVLPLLKAHDMPSRIRGRPPSHFWRINGCDCCLTKVDTKPPVSWNLVHRTNNSGEYMTSDSDGAAKQKALIIRRKGEPQVVVTATIFHAIMVDFKRANPYYFDKVGFPADKVTVSYSAIMPPEEYQQSLYEFFSKKSLGTPTENMHKETDAQKIPGTLTRLVSDGDATYASQMGGKEGVMAGSRIVLAAASRLTFTIATGRRQDVMVIPGTLRHTVHEAYTTNERYLNLARIGHITSVMDTRGVTHRSEKFETYRINPYKDMRPNELKPVLSRRGYQIRAQLPFLPTIVMGLPVTKYIPPITAGMSIVKYGRLPEDKDVFIGNRNPSLDTAAVITGEVTVDQNRVTLGVPPAIIKGYRGDYDGDEGPCTVVPDPRNQQILLNTMSAAALTSFSADGGTYAMEPIQDPIIAINDISRWCIDETTDMYYKVSPAMMTTAPYQALSDGVGASEFYVDLERFVSYVPVGAMLYEDYMSERNRVDTETDTTKQYDSPAPPEHDTRDPSAPAMYVSAEDLMRMLFPRNMPTMPGVIDLDSYQVALKELTKGDINATLGNLSHWVYKTAGNDDPQQNAQQHIRWVSWTYYILCEILTYNTSMGWLSPYDLCPKYYQPVNMSESHQIFMADPTIRRATKLQTDWAYTKLMNQEGPTEYRYALRYRRMRMFYEERKRRSTGELKAFYERIIKDTTVSAQTQSNAIVGMVRSKARGDPNELRRLNDGFGPYSYDYSVKNGPSDPPPPLYAPTFTPVTTWNLRYHPTPKDSPALSGVLFNPLAFELNLEECTTLGIIAIAALLQTPLTTTVTGVRARSLLSLYVGFRYENGIAYSPGAVMGRSVAAH